MLPFHFQLIPYECCTLLAKQSACSTQIFFNAEIISYLLATLLLKIFPHISDTHLAMYMDLKIWTENAGLYDLAVPGQLEWNAIHSHIIGSWSGIWFFKFLHVWGMLLIKNMKQMSYYIPTKIYSPIRALVRVHEAKKSNSQYLIKEFAGNQNTPRPLAF